MLNWIVMWSCFVRYTCIIYSSFLLFGEILESIWLHVHLYFWLFSQKRKKQRTDLFLMHKSAERFQAMSSSLEQLVADRQMEVLLSVSVSGRTNTDGVQLTNQQTHSSSPVCHSLSPNESFPKRRLWYGTTAQLNSGTNTSHVFGRQATQLDCFCCCHSFFNCLQTRSLSHSFWKLTLKQKTVKNPTFEN